MFKQEKYLCGDENDTADLAKKCTQVFKPGDLIALNGDLGSGKTFFVKQFCKAVNINNTSSPSFAIVNEYKAESKIYHFDFYRLKKVEELYDIGFDDYLLDRSAITFIEWAELFPEVLPLKHFEIKFVNLRDGKREITLDKYE